MSLRHLNLFSVPRAIVNQTEESLRKAGRDGMELFVLWSGLVEGNEFLVRTAHVPEQTSYRLEGGLMVRVDGDALHQLNAWLYERHEVLAFQVHSHPTAAFHSDTDDEFPIVTALGSISIVAADFCHDGLLADSTAVYRLDEHGWYALDPPLGLFRVK
jgi:hypothetical protein